MKYQLVIFDFDGTLADSFPWFGQIANSLADAYKFKRIEAHEVETLRGYSARQVIQHLGVPLWKLPFIARRMRALTANEVGSISLFAGVDRMLQRLSDEGITLALVTSNSYANVRAVLGPANAALIAHYECDVSMFGKRSRFRRVLKQTGVPPAQALCIGDEVRDIEAANKERIPFGAVTWGFTSIAALEAHGPAEVFAEVDDIVAAIV